MTRQNTFITPLDHERLITFSGAENRKFLQGQLTCDVNILTEGASVLGACCNPKGRVIANFRAVAIGEDLVITLPANQSAHLSEHLKKYAAFFRTVTITQCDNSSQWQRIGICGPEAAAIVAKLTGVDTPAANETKRWSQGLIVAVDNQRFELWLESAQASTDTWQILDQQATVGTSADWQFVDIISGIAWITEETREQWIPQHLNWQALNGISFKKGCYTGQEIVARMKYLGKLKSHLYRFSTPMIETLPTVGTAILGSAGKKCGDIVAVASDQEQRIELLAVVRKQDVEAGSLTLDGGSPLILEPMPYSLDE